MRPHLSLFAVLLFMFPQQVLAQTHNYSSENFRVRASSAKAAKDIADWAEVYRRELWDYWFGYDIPGKWSQPARIRVSFQPRREGRPFHRQIGGGATSFGLDGGQAWGWDLNLKGTAQGIIAAVLPHELNHTVLYSRLRYSLPRWMDEGASSLVEHPSSHVKDREEIREAIKTRTFIPFSSIINHRDYPSHGKISLWYAESFSLVHFLVHEEDQASFIALLQASKTKEPAWGFRAYYGKEYVNPTELESRWFDWWNKHEALQWICNPYQGCREWQPPPTWDRHGNQVYPHQHHPRQHQPRGVQPYQYHGPQQGPVQEPQTWEPGVTDPGTATAQGKDRIPPVVPLDKAKEPPPAPEEETEDVGLLTRVGQQISNQLDLQNKSLDDIKAGQERGLSGLDQAVAGVRGLLSDEEGVSKLDAIKDVAGGASVSLPWLLSAGALGGVPGLIALAVIPYLVRTKRLSRIVGRVTSRVVERRIEHRPDPTQQPQGGGTEQPSSEDEDEEYDISSSEETFEEEVEEDDQGFPSVPPAGEGRRTAHSPDRERVRVDQEIVPYEVEAREDRAWRDAIEKQVAMYPGRARVLKDLERTKDLVLAGYDDKLVNKQRERLRQG